MTANRPRNSLLALFDPLARPETPPRPPSSPDSASDKENDNPEQGPVSAFFNRVYKDTNVAQLPIGTLIDYADISMRSSASANSEVLEVNELQAGCASSDCSEEINQCGDMSPQRLPLAELKLEQLPPPTAFLPPIVTEDAQSPCPSDPPEEPEKHDFTQDIAAPPAVFITSAPSGTPLADVINSINHGDFPNISICPPDEELPSPSYQNENEAPITSADPSPTHLSPNSSMTSTYMRRHNINTDANDPRRVSVDLQTSFSIHLQSADMSFDLLNDKISFFGQPQDSSFWLGVPEEGMEDDASDFAKDAQNMQDTADATTEPDQPLADDDTFDFTREKQRLEALAGQYGSIQEEHLQAAEAAAEAAVVNSPRQRSQIEVPRPIFSLPPFTSTPKSSDNQEPQAAPSSQTKFPNIFSPPSKATPEVPRVLKPRRSSIAAPTALTSLPSVSALRIFKKTLKPDRERRMSSVSAINFNDNSRSTPSSTAVGSHPGPEPRRKLTTTTSLGLRPEGRSAQPVKGVQRPPVGAIPPPAPTRAAPLRTLVSSKRAVSTTQAPTRAASGTVSSLASVQRPATGPLPTSRAVQSASQRSAATAPTAPSTSKPTGLRVPTRNVSSASNTTSIGLPARPALPKPSLSKLPGPSRTFSLGTKTSVPARKT